MPLSGALALLLTEVAILAGGLAWTFRRAQLPIGWRGAAGLALVVGVSQALLATVVQAGFDVAAGGEPFAGVIAHRVHWASVAAGAVAVCGAAPLALQRYLRLDARWTRALSRELLAGFIASTFGAIVIAGGALLAALVIAGLVRSW